MNEVDNDSRLEDRLRETLRAVADTTPSSDGTSASFAGSTPERPEPRPLARSIAAAAALVVLIAGVAVMLRSREEDAPPASRRITPTPLPADELPAGFDLMTATPVFSAAGEPLTVAEAYLYDRFPDAPTPLLPLERPVVDGELAIVRWKTGDDGGQIASGRIFLRRSGGVWAVVAATTDGMSLRTLSYDGERVRGVVTSTNQNSLFADVLDWRGEPVHRAPRPKGFDGAAYRFGTAAGPADSELRIDIANPQAPTVVRINLVGGTILSIAEVRFDPQPLAPHNDYDRCIADGQTKEKEPTPDIVQRSCANSLQGAIIGNGVAGDRTWELIASDEPSGHWVTLRSRDQVGTYRFSSQGPDGAGSPGSLFMQIGPCCSVGDFTAVVGAVAADVTAVRLLTEGYVYEAQSVGDPTDASTRYAVVLMGARTGQARVEFQKGGRWVPGPSDLNLAILGG